MLKLHFFVFSLFLIKIIKCDQQISSDNFNQSYLVNLTLENSPYEIQQDLIVPVNKTLVINPGVELKLWPRVKIVVHGSLIANGTSNQHISMRPYYNKAYLDTSFSTFLKIDSDGNLKGLVTSDYEQLYMASNNTLNNDDVKTVCKVLGYLGDADITSSIKKIDYQYKWFFYNCQLKNDKVNEDCTIRNEYAIYNSISGYSYDSYLNKIKCDQTKRVHHYWDGIKFYSNQTSSSSVFQMSYIDLIESGSSKEDNKETPGSIYIHIASSSNKITLSNIKINSSLSYGLNIYSNYIQNQ